jgi:TRAP-type mannitol/chloroaromatic compound transport system permease small subunit
MQLERILRGIDRISEWTGKTAIWLIIPLTLVVAYEVISRRIFNAPHIWATEVTAYFYGPHFMLVAAYTLLSKGHVSIDLLFNRLSYRAQGILETINYLIFFFPFCGLLFYHGTLFAQTSWAQHETSGSAALPVVPEIKTVIPLTFALLLLQGLANFIRSLILAIRGKAL